MHHPLLEKLTCLWFPDWIPLISSPTSLNFFFSDFDSSIHSLNVYLPKCGLLGVPLFSLLFHLAIQLSGPQQLVLCDWHPKMYFSLPPKFTFFISMYLDILLPYRTQLYMYSQMSFFSCWSPFGGRKPSSSIYRKPLTFTSLPMSKDLGVPL